MKYDTALLADAITISADAALGVALALLLFAANIDLVELIIEFENAAIGLGLSFIAFDDADHFLRIRLQLGHV